MIMITLYDPLIIFIVRIIVSLRYRFLNAFLSQKG